MDEVRASVPRADVKLDQAIARNSKRRNPVEFRSGAVAANSRSLDGIGTSGTSRARSAHFTGISFK